MSFNVFAIHPGFADVRFFGMAESLEKVNVSRLSSLVPLTTERFYARDTFTGAWHEHTLTNGWRLRDDEMPSPALHVFVDLGLDAEIERTIDTERDKLRQDNRALHENVATLQGAIAAAKDEIETFETRWNDAIAEAMQDAQRAVEDSLGAASEPDFDDVLSMLDVDLNDVR